MTRQSASVTVNVHPRRQVTVEPVPSEDRVVVWLGDYPTVVRLFLDHGELDHLTEALSAARDALYAERTEFFLAEHPELLTGDRPDGQVSP